MSTELNVSDQPAAATPGPDVVPVSGSVASDDSPSNGRKRRVMMEVIPDDEKYADEECIVFDSMDDVKRGFTAIALDFLRLAQNRRCAGQMHCPVAIPEDARTEVCSFKGKHREFVMAMWSVPIGTPAYRDIRPSLDTGQAAATDATIPLTSNADVVNPMVQTLPNDSDAFLDDNVYVLLDEITAVWCPDGEAGTAYLRDGRTLILSYSAPAVLARLRATGRG